MDQPAITCTSSLATWEVHGRPKTHQSGSLCASSALRTGHLKSSVLSNVNFWTSPNWRNECDESCVLQNIRWIMLCVMNLNLHKDKDCRRPVRDQTELITGAPSHPNRDLMSASARKSRLIYFIRKDCIIADIGGVDLTMYYTWKHVAPRIDSVIKYWVTLWIKT